MSRRTKIGDVSVKKVLITGCSWVLNIKEDTSEETYEGVDFDLASFPGQGLWKIKEVLSIRSNLNDYDCVVVQLPTPVRNTPNGRDTTADLCRLIDSFDDDSKESVVKNSMNEYKQKVKEIDALHDNTIFFWYNLVGYPFKHPFNYGDEIINDLHKFFNDYNLIHLSFEGQSGYHIKERLEEDEEFVDYYYQNYPSHLNGKYNDNCYLSKVPGTIVEDGHPNQRANLIALKKIYDYIIGD